MEGHLAGHLQWRASGPVTSDSLCCSTRKKKTTKVATLLQHQSSPLLSLTLFSLSLSLLETRKLFEEMKAWAVSDFLSHSPEDHQTFSLSILSQPHLSLSKPFYLIHHTISSFLEKLSSTLQSSFSHLLAITLSSSYTILLNEEENRGFICLLVDANEALKRIVKDIDEVMIAFHQPVYHTKPIFHISVASFEVNDSNRTFLERNGWQSRVVVRQLSGRSTADSSDLSDNDVTRSSKQSQLLSVTSLLASYGSDSDNDGESCNRSDSEGRSNDDGEQEETQTTDQQDAIHALNSDNRQLMVAITLDRIHCRIGNRLYQRLYDNHPSMTSNASKTSFELINDTVPIEATDEF
eukprot:scaffold1088_cov177-Ochromonas_danica.AAC.2